MVEPHSLVNVGRRSYLVAWDCEREAWRTFRVDRLAPAGSRFSLRKLPGAIRPRSSASILSDAPVRHQARVTVHAPAGELTHLMGGAVTSLDARTCEYRAGDDDLDWLAVRIPDARRRTSRRR